MGLLTSTVAATFRVVPPENLHEEVIRSSSELFADGHYEAAVSEAFKSIEVRVRELTGSTQSGVKLMGEVFGGTRKRPLTRPPAA